MRESQIKMIADDKFICSVGKWNVYELSDRYFVIQMMTNIEVLTFSYYGKDQPYDEAIDYVINFALSK